MVAISQGYLVRSFSPQILSTSNVTNSAFYATQAGIRFWSFDKAWVFDKVWSSINLLELESKSESFQDHILPHL